jgi:hypothetical protein
VNAVVEGWTGVIGRGWDFDPQNGKLVVGYSVSIGGRND